jgi:chromosome segregation ATPase
MALSSGSKKSTQSDSDSESDDEVRDELPFLRQENERLGTLLDNRDDMLREVKKMRKELRASLEDASTRVAELDTQVLDSKLRLIPLRLALLFRMRLILLIAPYFLPILICLRRSMPPSVRN